jgi:uncharacterized protein YuzE
MMNLLLSYDPDGDVLYVSFREVGEGEIASTSELDPVRHVDYDANGDVVGVEFLDVRDGISLEGIPRTDEVRQALTQLLGARVVTQSAA